jgi:hypothetical protein
MPSEQLAGRPQFSSDVYAAGMIAIQGITGQLPHTIPTHPHSGEMDWHGLAPHCHPALVTLLDYMVQYDFRSRYATASEALAALQETFPQTSQSMAPRSRDAAHYRTFGSSSQASPSRAVQTVAVGRRPQPSTNATASPQSGPGGSRRRERSGGNPFLPLGLVLVALFGLGALAWRAFLYSPAAETASQDTDAPANVTPESNPSDDAPLESLSLEPETAPVAEPETVAELPSESPESSDEELEDSAEAPAPEAMEPEPADGSEPALPLTPAAAQTTVSNLYGYVSNQSWDAARGLFGESLAQQFDPDFFEQFEQVTVDNLRVTNQTSDTVELTGRNTYYYPDGSRQQEERTFRVQMVEGQPRIVGSD